MGRFRFMDKFKYFIHAILNGNAGRTHWVKSVFSAMEHEFYDAGKHQLLPKDAPRLLQDQALTYPFRLFRNKNDAGQIEIVFIHRNEQDESEIGVLGLATPKQPILHFRDPITIDSSHIPTAEGNINTCYGNFLLNWLLFYLPFGTKIPFQTGHLDGGACDKIVVSKFARSKPKPGKEPNPNEIQVSEYLVYQKNASYLDSWSSFATASMSILSLTPNAEVDKFIKDSLKALGHPPTVTELATIEEKAAKMDREALKGTEDEFFLNSKNYNVNRKKMFYIYGLEEGFGLSTIVEQPLSEGIQTDKLPDYANALRAASFNRGAQTALGGVGVKRANQIFQSIRIASDDCNDKEGFRYVAYQVSDLSGTYVFMKDGLRIPTPEEATQLLGKEILIRSPMTCKEKTPHYCAKCVGESVAMLPNGVHNSVAAINSAEMLIFMKAMHGKSLSTVEYDIARSIC